MDCKTDCTPPLIVHPMGGLANRMRAMVSGIMLGRLLRRRVGMRWAVNSDLHCPFEALFDVAATGVSVENISAFRDLWIDDIPRKKNLFFPVLHRPFRQRRLFYDNRAFVSLSANRERMIEAMQSERGPIDIRSGLQFFGFAPDDYRSLMRPLPIFRQRALELLGEAADGVIGLHIRRTDNDVAARESPTCLFEERIRGHLATEPSLKFFLATDDERVKRRLRSGFGASIITMPEAAVRHTPEGILNAMTEMVALSLTRCIYGSYWSSFSEAASLLGDIPLIQLRRDYSA